MYNGKNMYMYRCVVENEHRTTSIRRRGLLDDRFLAFEQIARDQSADTIKRREVESNGNKNTPHPAAKWFSTY